VHFVPAQIAAVLASVEGTRPRFELALQRVDGQDCVEIRVEVSEKIFFDDMRRQRQLGEEAARRVREELGIPVRVKLVEPRSFVGEGVRVIDER
jgi:phenylacetate-CoA ligase